MTKLSFKYFNKFHTQKYENSFADSLFRPIYTQQHRTIRQYPLRFKTL